MLCSLKSSSPAPGRSQLRTAWPGQGRLPEAAQTVGQPAVNDQRRGRPPERLEPPGVDRHRMVNQLPEEPGSQDYPRVPEDLVSLKWIRNNNKPFVLDRLGMGEANKAVNMLDFQSTINVIFQG